MAPAAASRTRHRTPCNNNNNSNNHNSTQTTTAAAASATDQRHTHQPVRLLLLPPPTATTVNVVQLDQLRLTSHSPVAYHHTHTRTRPLRTAPTAQYRPHTQPSQPAVAHTQPPARHSAAHTEQSHLYTGRPVHNHYPPTTHHPVVTARSTQLVCRRHMFQAADVRAILPAGSDISGTTQWGWTVPEWDE